MEEIKVGEYVRINNDNRNCIGVGKAIKILNDVIYVDMSNKYNLLISFKIEKITKHSFNLIDLIEVGDIVFIEDVLNNDFVYVYDEKMLKAVREDIEEGLQITEVLTHEQYEANSYKVE